MGHGQQRGKTSLKRAGVEHDTEEGRLSADCFRGTASFTFPVPGHTRRTRRGHMGLGGAIVQVGWV